MRFYGIGCLRAPGTTRLIWDFTDGPFDTLNQDVILAAYAQGFSDKPLEPVASKPMPVVVSDPVPQAEFPQVPAPKRQYKKKVKK